MSESASKADTKLMKFLKDNATEIFTIFIIGILVLIHFRKDISSSIKKGATTTSLPEGNPFPLPEKGPIKDPNPFSIYENIGGAPQAAPAQEEEEETSFDDLSKMANQKREGGYEEPEPEPEPEQEAEPEGPPSCELPDPDGVYHSITDDGVQVDTSVKVETYISKVRTSDRSRCRGSPKGYDEYNKLCMPNMPRTEPYVYAFDMTQDSVTPQYGGCDPEECFYYGKIDGLNMIGIENDNGDSLIDYLVKEIWCDRIPLEPFEATLKYMKYEDGTVRYTKKVGPLEGVVKPNDVLINLMYKDPENPKGIHVTYFNYALQIMHLLLVMKRDGVAKPKGITINFKVDLRKKKG
jgi:hypothetical protein